MGPTSKLTTTKGSCVIYDEEQLFAQYCLVLIVSEMPYRFMSLLLYTQQTQVCAANYVLVYIQKLSFSVANYVALKTAFQSLLTIRQGMVSFQEIA